MFRVALRLLLAAALGAVPSLARADVYRWVDDAGATHYATSRDAIPRPYRSTAVAIPQPRTTIANPSSSLPPTPAPTPAVAPAPAPAAAPIALPVEPPPPSASSPEAAPLPATQPALESMPSESSAPITPAPTAPVSATPVTHSTDPREDEIAQLQGQIDRDRDTLRQLISTPRWDSEELASDPRVREIAERLPRLQAELAALRTEAGH